MARLSQSLVVFLVVIAGCETRRSRLEAINDYRVEAPKYYRLKTAREEMRAGLANARKALAQNRPGLALITGRPATPEETARQRREFWEGQIAFYDRECRKWDRLIAELEPKVEALRKRLGPDADRYLKNDSEVWNDL